MSRISKRAFVLNALVVMAALGLAAGGCKKKGDAGKAKGSSARGNGPKGANSSGSVGSGRVGSGRVGPSGPLDKLEAPPQVVAFGGASSAKKLLAGVSDMASAIMPAAPPFVTMMQMALQQQLGLSDGSAIDLDLPVRVAIVDPQKYRREPIVFVVGTKGKEKVVAALTSKKKDVEGNAYAVDTKSGRKAYINFIGNHMVVTANKKLFQANKAFLTKLIGASIKGAAAIVIDIKHIHALYGSMVDQQLDMADKQLQSNPMLAQQAKGLAGMIPGIKKVFAGADRAMLALGFPKSGAKLTATFRPKSGSSLAKGLAMVKPIDNSCFGRVSANTPVVVAVNLDPMAISGALDTIMSFSFSMMPADADAKKKLLDLVSAAWKQMKGDIVMTAPDVGGKAFALAGLYGVKDGTAFQQLMVQMMKFYYTSPKFVEAYKKLGMEISFKAAAYKVGDTPVSVSHMKLFGPALAMNPIAKLMGNFFTTHIAARGDAAYFGYGPAAKPALAKLMSGKVDRPLSADPGFKQALANAAPGMVFMLYMSPSMLGKRLAAASGATNAMASDTPGGVALSFGMQGSVASLVIDVPKAQLGAIRGIARLAGGMMGR